MIPAKRVIWFGGQGSRHLFSNNASHTAAEDARSSSAAAILLSRCHTAFLEEMQDPNVDFEGIFGTACPMMASPEDLLHVSPELQSNAIIQSTTICLYQLLRYISTATLDDSDFKSSARSVAECSGFCCGILPAAVVSSAASAEDFVRWGVEAYRLAFWTGYRSAEHCHLAQGSPPTRLPCSLVLRGVREESLVALLDEHNAKLDTKSLHFAAAIDYGTTSVSGVGSDLADFKATCEAPGGFAHVHARYHGGEQMHSVVKAVLKDVSTRQIMFPEFRNLLVPLRSASDGTRIGHGPDTYSTLVECLLHQILVQPVQWMRLVDSTLEDINNESTDGASGGIELHCYGPSSRSLLTYFDAKAESSGIQALDHSHFIETDSSPPTPQFDDKDVAIVGMGLNLPNGNDTAQLWETLCEAFSAVREIPESRFDTGPYTDSDLPSSNKRRMGTKHGCFLDDPWAFDPAFFNVSPREARSMDPQQRVLLTTAQKALEDSGYVPDATRSTQRHSFGCYVGVATGDYTDNLRDEIDVYYSTGTLRAFLSGKLSYAYRMSGPSVVTDTACSSSLVSVYQACRSLQTGDCTAAIAGGINTISSPDMYMGLDRAHFLSHTGGCKPFDAAADGYGRSEGCVLFVLKKFSDALADNDRIHGVIKGVEVNQCGTSHSITHPHSETQVELFDQVFAKSNIPPSSIDVVEAHGTGTQAGDYAELSSLSAKFGDVRNKDDPVFVSSIKGSVGHSEAASGAAGLAKLILMMKHQTIPPQGSLTNINPRLAKFLETSIAIPREILPWNARQTPRRALLNNFGAAGSNCALILQEPPKKQQNTSSAATRSMYPFSISARSPKALGLLAEDYIRSLGSSPESIRLVDICYTASARRQIYEYCTTFGCVSKTDLQDQLGTVNTEDVATRKHVKSKIFVFSGQGGLYFGMGSELLDTAPRFRKIVDYCVAFLEGLGVPDVEKYLRDGSNDKQSITDLEHVVGSQCACVVLEYALARFFIDLGIQPDVVCGHSLGEYAAMAIAGAVSIEDTLRIVARRAQLMRSLCAESTSGMVACQLGPDKAHDLMKDSFSSGALTIACHNSSTDCVISGSLDQLELFKECCKSSKVKSKLLLTPYGFHSSFIEPITEPLDEFCRSVSTTEPTIPILSNVTGNFLTKQDLDPGYFGRHACSKVNFAGLVETLNAQDQFSSGLIIEIGPQPTTLPMIRSALSTGKDTTFIASLQNGREPWSSLIAALSQVSKTDVPIAWPAVFEHSGAEFVDLPGHPLIQDDFRVQYHEGPLPSKNRQTAADVGEPTQLRLLPRKLSSNSSDTQHVFQTTQAVLAKFIQGHDVGGTAICPASVFYELMVEAASYSYKPGVGSIVSVADLEFSSPLMHDAAKPDAPIHVNLSYPSDSTKIHATVTTPGESPNRSTLHCSAVVRTLKATDAELAWRKPSAMITRQSAHLLGARPQELDTFTTSMLYDRIFPRVVQYSAEYQSIQRLSVLTSTLQGVGTFSVPENPDNASFIVSPYFSDTLLHAAGFIANTSVGNDEICICGKVDSLETIHEKLDLSETFTVYCSLFALEEGIMSADAYAVNASGKIVAAVAGMQFKKLNIRGFRRHLEKARGTVNVDPAPVQTAESRETAEPTSPPKCQTYDAAAVSEKFSKVVHDVCGFNDKQADASKGLKQLGVDSLMTMELKAALQDAFADLVIADLEIDPEQSLESLSDAVSAASHDRSTAANTEPQTPLTTPGPSRGSPSGLGDSDDSQKLSKTAHNSKGTQVIDLVAEISGAARANLTSDVALASLGVDSLLTIELGQAVGKLFGSDITEQQIQGCRTIGDVQDLEPRASRSDSKPDTSQGANGERDTRALRAGLLMSEFPAPLQDSNPQSCPLYLVHDGSGTINDYSRLQSLERPAYGIFNPAFFNSDQGPGSVDEMAHRYLSQVGKTDVKEVILAGWSFGGVVAFAMAHLQFRVGVKVRGVILIDSPYPVEHKPLPEAIITHVAGGAPSSEEPKRQPSALQEIVSEQFKANAEMLCRFEPPRAGLQCPVVMLRSTDTFDAQTLCGVSYPWLGDQEERTRAIDAWKALTKQEDMHVLDIPGNHFEAFAATNIPAVTAQIKKACEIIERGRST